MPRFSGTLVGSPKVKPRFGKEEKKVVGVPEPSELSGHSVEQPVQYPTPQLAEPDPVEVSPRPTSGMDMLKGIGQEALEQVGATVEDVRESPLDIPLGMVEGPATVLSGIGGFMAGVPTSLSTLLGYTLEGEPIKGMAEAGKEMEKVMEAITYTPRTEGGKKIAEYAAMPFALAHEGIEDVVRSLGGDDEKVKAAQFAFDAALFGLPLIKAKIKAGKTLTARQLLKLQKKAKGVPKDALKVALDKANKANIKPMKQEATVPANQTIVDALQAEAIKRTGPNRMKYNEARKVVQYSKVDASKIDPALLAKSEGSSVRKLVKKLIKERSERDLLLEHNQQVNVEFRDLYESGKISDPHRLAEARTGIKTPTPAELKKLKREPGFVGKTGPEIIEGRILPVVETPDVKLNFLKEQTRREVRQGLKDKFKARKEAAKLGVESKIDSVESKELAAGVIEYKKAKVEKLNSQVRGVEKAIKETDLALHDDNFKTFSILKDAENYMKISGKQKEILQDPATKRYMLEPELKDFEDLSLDVELDFSDYNRFETEALKDRYEGNVESGQLSDSRITELWRIINNESGAVDISSLGIFVNDLKKFKAKAEKLGISPRELGDMVGLDPETSKLILEGIGKLPKLEDQYRRSNPITYDLLNPKVENILVQRAVEGSNGKRYKIPFTKEAYDAVHSAIKHNWYSGKILQRATKVAEYMEHTEVPIYAFETFGKGMKGLFYDTWTKLATIADREIKIQQKEIFELTKDLSRQDRRDIAIAGLARSKGGKRALSGNGITEIPVLSEAHEAILQNLMERYELLHDRINYVREKTGQKPLPKLRNYLPFIHAMNTMKAKKADISLFTSTPRQIKAMQKDFSGSYFPYEKTRKVTDIPLELDIFRAYNKYISYAMKEIHVAPIAALAKEAAVIGIDVKGRKGKVSLLDTNPDAARLLIKWSDDILGIDNAGAGLAIKYPNLIRTLDSMSRGAVVAMIGFNTGTLSKQPTALVGTMAMTGPTSTVIGIAKSMSENRFTKGETVAKQKSNVLSIRSMDIMLEEWAETIRLGRLSDSKKMLAQASLKGIGALDAIVAEASWYSAEWYGSKKLGLKGEELIQYADDITTKTQGMGIRGATADVQSIPFLRHLAVLQTFAIANFNLIARDILGIKNPNINKGTALARVLKFTAGVALVNSAFQFAGLDPPFPAPIDAYFEAKKEGDGPIKVAGKVAVESGEIFPLIGSSIRYDSSLGGVIGELLSDIPSSTKTLVESLDWGKLSDKQKTQAALEIGKTLGLATGTPGTNMLVKGIRSAENGGSVYQVIMGIYPEKPKSGRKRVRSFDSRPSSGIKEREF